MAEPEVAPQVRAHRVGVEHDGVEQRRKRGRERGLARARQPHDENLAHQHPSRTFSPSGHWHYGTAHILQRLERIAPRQQLLIDTVGPCNLRHDGGTADAWARRPRGSADQYWALCRAPLPTLLKPIESYSRKTPACGFRCSRAAERWPARWDPRRRYGPTSGRGRPWRSRRP